MGYTHYFTRTNLELPKEVFTDIVNVSKIIIEMAIRDGIEIVNGDGEKGTTPTITEDIISLNGVEKYGHETFILDFKQNGFEFCKTNLKDYDGVVVSILKYIKENYSQYYKISSDGDPECWEYVPYTFIKGE